MAQVLERKTIHEISRKVALTKILATTDFSPESDRALDYALALARGEGIVPA